MKKVLMTLFVSILMLSAGLPDAEARRMGGGGSFGKQSQQASRPAPMQNQAASPAKPATPAAAAPPTSPWRGLLGGALLGLGLGALLSSMGLGGAMASMISTLLMVGLVAMVGMLAFRWYQRRSATARTGFANASSGSNSPFSQTGSDRFTPAQPMSLQSLPSQSSTNARSGGYDGATIDAMHGDATAAAIGPWGVPADFDIVGFVRHAKTSFIRLQAAWDKANVNDIAEFTTPEMFGEIKMQIQERGAAANHTDVMALEAVLLGIETVGDIYLASVKFSGVIKEDSNASATPFTEVWNLSKPLAGQGGWTLAGIQQLQA
jgi:predicted lipid-binding transport protein (Tim44 family)